MNTPANRAIVALCSCVFALAVLVHLTRPAPRASTPALTLRASPPPRDEPPSVVLITLDTTRADALGCYGAKGNPTPHLDRLAEQGVRFEHALAPIPLTLPSHASMLSGRYPPEFGVRDNSPTPIPRSTPLVTEAFQSAGHFTAAFVSAEPVMRHWGLNRGFDLYNDATERRARLTPAERRGDRTVDVAITWLRAWMRTGKPFFLWVHLFDPHHPYEAPKPFAQRFSDPYLAEIAWTDHCVGRLLDEIAAAGRTGSTAVVVAADHGEGRGEHGESTHGHLVQQSTMRVPLIFAWPGRWRAGATVPTPVSLVDVAPTLYHVLDVAAPTMSGRTLLRTLAGEEDAQPRRLYGESLYDFVHFGWAPLYSIRDGDHVLIDADGQARLFDVVRDPGQRTDLAEREPELRRRLARSLARLRGSLREAAPARGGALAAPPGYLQGSAAGPALARDRRLRGKRPVPMDRMPIIDAFEAAKQASFRRSDRESALATIDRLLEEDAENPSLHYWRGRTLRHLGLDAAARGPQGRDAAIRHYFAARDAFERVLKRRPDHRGAQNLLVQTCLLSGDPAATIQAGQAMLDEGFDSPMVRVFMAQAYLLPGPHHDAEKAAALLEESVARHGETKAHAELRRRIGVARALALRNRPQKRQPNPSDK